MANINNFIYVHILKCAGTTVRNTICRNSKLNCLYDAKFKPRQNGLVTNFDHPVILEPQPYPVNYKHYDAIFGHFKHDKYSHLKWPMFSFIREPIARLVSQYYYHERFYTERKIGIIEFAKSFQNYMSYVLGDINQYTYIGTVENFNESLKEMCKIIGIKNPQHIVQERRYGHGKKVTKKIRKQLKSMNEKDINLYKEIRKRQ